MPFGKPLLSFLEKHRLPLIVLIAAFLLLGIEELMEQNYRCPDSITLRNLYIFLYFIIPIITLLILGVYCQIHVLKLPTKTWGEKFHTFAWALFLALFWAVILLWDGKYIDCVCSSPKRNNIKEIAQEGSNTDIVSKIAGGVLFFILFAVNVFYIKRYYSMLKELVRSEEFPKWEVEGKASYLTAPQDLHTGNRKDLSFHFIVTKPPPSQDTGDQNAEDEQVDSPTVAGIEMSQMGQSSPSVSS